MAGAYEEINRVETMHNGIPIVFKLQKRSDVKPVPYFTMSWRTYYKSGKNRRFYIAPSQGGCWIIPVSVARKLLEQAESKGMMSEKFDDPYKRFGGGIDTLIDSRDIASPGKVKLLSDITTEFGDFCWGRSPVFAVGEEPSGTWRKAMIIDIHSELCTFRSTTTDTSYKPARVQGMKSPWILDNAMQDANAAVMRFYLKVLRSI